MVRAARGAISNHCIIKSGAGNSGTIGEVRCDGPSSECFRRPGGPRIQARRVPAVRVRSQSAGVTESDNGPVSFYPAKKHQSLAKKRVSSIHRINVSFKLGMRFCKYCHLF
eukprot:658159-Hanusia_phi.AAC.1